MKILLICPRLCHGGAERVAVCLANGFVERGHHVRFMADLFEEQSFTLDNRVKLINLISTNDSKIKKWGGAIKNVRKEIRRTPPDVIIGIMPLCSFISKIATLGLNIPVIATEHDSFERPISAPMSKTLQFNKFCINKIYDGVTVLTRADKIIIGKRLKNVMVMPNPLATNPIDIIPNKEKNIFAAGRVDNWHVKGFDVLINAWRLLIMRNGENEKMRDWKLQIAGVWRNENTIPYLTGLIPDGEWTSKKERGEKREESTVWRSEKYRIEFLGFRNDMEELYKKSSIFVLSSRYEAFGLVLIEAMSQGCAPVACDYKGRQREILSPLQGDSLKVNGYSDHGIEVTENGILCEPDNVEALTSALKKMMVDEEYRKEVQRNAIERSKFYNKEHTMDRWEEYLKIVIS